MAQRGDQGVETTITQAIAEIAADNRSGAVQIAERAADILHLRATMGQAPSPDAFRREMLTTGWALIRAQKVMAPLVNLVNTVLWKIEETESPTSLPAAVEQATDEFKRQMRQNAHTIAEGALGLIGDSSKIVTLSNSSTIHRALIHAQRAGRRPTVICAESLPGREGHDAAAKLEGCGLAVVLMDDKAALKAIEDADLVLVGADMVTNRGLVNKLGTYRMASAAKASGTSFYTICGSEKFLPPGFHPIDDAGGLVEPHRGDQPHTVALGNLPFDFTPLELLSGIVTEQGILPVAAIEAWLAATQLHPSLASQFSEAVP